MEELLKTADNLKTKFREAKLNMECKLATIGVKVDQSFVDQFIELDKKLDIMCKSQDLEVMINNTIRSSDGDDEVGKEIGKHASLEEMTERKATKRKVSNLGNKEGGVIEGRLEETRAFESNGDPHSFLTYMNESFQHLVTKEQDKHEMLSENELLLQEDVDFEVAPNETEYEKQLECFHQNQAGLYS